MTATVWMGMMMSPSDGILQRLMTVLTTRWFMATMTPLPGMILTWMPAMCGDLARPRAGGVDDDVGADQYLFISGDVTHSRPDDAFGAVVVLHQQLDDLVVGQYSGAGLRRGLCGGVCRQETVGCSVRHFEDATDARMQQRFPAQRLSHRYLCAGKLQRIAGCFEPVWVLAFILRRNHEEAAGVFDTVRVRLAQDAVFANALLGANRVFDDIPAAAVQQAVVATGGAVGQVSLLDEY